MIERRQRENDWRRSGLFVRWSIECGEMFAIEKIDETSWRTLMQLALGLTSPSYISDNPAAQYQSPGA